MAVVFPRQKYLLGISSCLSWTDGLCTGSKLRSSANSLSYTRAMVTSGGPAHSIALVTHGARLP